MTSEKVMASVILKSRSGLSVFRDPDRLTLSRVKDFRPESAKVDEVAGRLVEAGFTVEAQTPVGVSFSGHPELFEEEFSITVRRKTLVLQQENMLARELFYFEASKPQFMNSRLEAEAEAVQLAIPGIPFHNALPPAPNPPYYFLNVLNDVPTLLHADALHAAGITGTGVRISMVDTGIVTRVTETHSSTGTSSVVVNHTIRDVQGVWLATDPGHTGVNYFIGGNFAGTTITFGTPLPTAGTDVEVVYSCLHPHYLAQDYTWGDIRAVGDLDINTDEFGHGTAMAANALAMAPGCTFSFVKYSDGAWSNFPLAGFQAAIQHQNPDVITCSWGTLGIDNALVLEIVNAVANGIVVIFAAGNGHTDNPAHIVTTVAHPDLISAGGGYPIQGGGLRASNYASSYDSFIYTNPQRHCPDIVGLVGEQPRACLIMLPTEPRNTMDLDLASSGAFPDGDNTAVDDGWCVCSGTSAAAPQTAGTVALLLEQRPGLSPMAVKNILENSATDIQFGMSHNGEHAGPGWDPATGFGLLNAAAAVDYLRPGRFDPYIRDSVTDNGTEPVGAARLWASPDIIVRNEPVDDPQAELGQTLKHHYDLSDQVEDGQDNFIYLRVQNRGTLAGDCTATIYFTDPGMFANPAVWTNIGQVTINDLAPGEFRVVGPVTWSDSQIPTSGHYCLISVLDSPSDPAPDLTAITSEHDFTNMVRDSNNVAWKNINVEDVIPGGASSWSFYMEGPRGTGHQADLEIDLMSFPAGATVLVKVVKRLAETATLDHLTVADQSQLYTTLAHSGGIGALEGMDFKSNERTKVTIYYTIPNNAPEGNYTMRVTLRVDGDNVGSYTKIVNVTHFSYIGNRRSKEIHRRQCVWVRKMSHYNRIPLVDLEEARRRGFDNCAFCIGGSLR
ncbi:S8 family serine peptidase [Thermodesulfobacteriota bacterium B35]